MDGAAIISGSQETKPMFKALTDIEKIDEEETYSKSELAQMWGVHRRTIIRWHELALENAPLYSAGFYKAVNQATCEKCGEAYEASNFDCIAVIRRWPIPCSHCNTKGLPQIKPVASVDKSKKIGGIYAKALRLVGVLYNEIGQQKTIEALTTSPDPEHKKMRAFIRGFLDKGVGKTDFKPWHRPTHKKRGN